MLLRRLGSDDAARFFELRLFGAAQAPLGFRIAPDDVRKVPVDVWATRLASDVEYIAGIFDESRLVAIGGVSQVTGEKLNHKALLWGMFIHPEYRNLGLGRRIVVDLVNAARKFARSVHLTLMADNQAALNLYLNCGFVEYGREPMSVRQGTEFGDEILMWRATDVKMEQQQ